MYGVIVSYFLISVAGKKNHKVGGAWRGTGLFVAESGNAPRIIVI